MASSAFVAPEALRAYVPVRMPDHQPVVVAPPVPVPDVGLRWGDPSAFKYSSYENRGGGGADDEEGGGGAPDDDPAWPVQEQQRKYVGKEVFRAFQKMEVVGEGGGSPVPFERITECIFDFGVYETIEVKQIDELRKQRIRVQTRHYVSWTFPLHEGGTVVGTGERGERPEEPKPKKPSIGEVIRATKQFWIDELGSPDITIGQKVLGAPN